VDISADEEKIESSSAQRGGAIAGDDRAVGISNVEVLDHEDTIDGDFVSWYCQVPNLIS
jgi:hypothetical protein